MEPRVLIAYATKHGSTREVAERVAERLRAHGLDVEVQATGGIRELDDYGAVVLGGALYMGRWHDAARGFLKRHRTKLAAMPVAVFGMVPPRCPTPTSRRRASSSSARWRGYRTSSRS